MQGKGAIVGVDGEIEHAAALIHPRFGAPVRGALGDATEIIPSTKKMGGPGAALAVPLTSKKSIWEFDHMDAAEITVADAPHAGEIVVILARRPLAPTKPSMESAETSGLLPDVTVDGFGFRVAHHQA